MNLPMVAGGESPERIALLLKLLPKLSKNTCEALTAHFVKGYDTDWIYELYGIAQPNFSPSATKLNSVNDTVEELKFHPLWDAVRISLLLSLIPRFSDSTRQALTAYFLNKGDLSCGFQPRPNLKRSINKLIAVSDIANQIKERDQFHLSYMKKLVTCKQAGGVNHV
jgi:hypothetical protein